MARRLPYATKIRHIYPAKPGRIKMGQSPVRSIRITQRAIISYKLENPWWWILHRRGITREFIGQDPREFRAIPRNLVKGTLPERIVYRYLAEQMKMVDNVDFDFQSSVQGGRLNLGGIVADFLFPYLMIIIRVQGPTHNTHLRMRKDEEQRLALEEMGYRVFDMDENLIYNEIRFEEEMRRIFNMGPSAYGGEFDLLLDWDLILTELRMIKSKVLHLAEV